MKPGDRVGRYVLESLLGEGGMGQVFRAYDEVLRRRVAVKVLRAASAEAGSGEGSSPTVGRILREARMAAALDHPNVVSIFDFGEDRGVPYIVMELVAGRPLRAFIGSGEVPASERIRWLVDVARALSAAHRAGLVHRDIKPENVLLRDDGVVKVLDFGIARRAAGAHPPVSAGGTERSHHEPGHTHEEGQIIGTPGYMAPEQIRGEVLGAAVDQFAWGVLAHELLTGKLPWRGGPNGGSILLEVTSASPVILGADSLGAPEGVTRVVERALRKGAAERFSSMADLLTAMGVPLHAAGGSTIPPAHPTPERVSAPAAAGITPAELGVAQTEALVSGQIAPSASTMAESASRRSSRAVAVAWGTLALVGLVVTVGLVLRQRAPSPIAPREVSAPESGPLFRPHDTRRITFGYGCEEFPSITPDGRTVVFDGESGPDFHVFELDLRSGAQREVTHGAGWQYAPRLSPDGTRVAYLRKEGRALTAVVVPLARADGEGGTEEREIAKGRMRPRWSPDGRAVWAGEDQAKRIDVASGEVTRTIEPPSGSLPLTVEELPDGRAVVLFVERETHRMRGVAVYPLGKTEPAWLTHERLDEVLATTPDGEHVIVAHIDATNESELWRLPLDGGPPEALPTPGSPPNKGMAITPKGDRVVWSDCGIQAHLALLHRQPDGGLAARPLFPPAEWTDDGPSPIPGTAKLVVVSDRSDGNHLWILDMADGAGAARSTPDEPRMIPTPGVVPGAPAVSPDGRWVAFGTVAGGIHVAPVDGSGAPRRLTSGVADTSPTFDRSGRQIYFQTTTASGSPRVFVVPFEGGEPAPVLDEGTASPSASRASDLLAYVARDGDSEAGHPMLLDLRTHRARPLSSRLASRAKSVLRLSPDGTRAAMWTGTEVVEVDLASGDVVARFDSGADQLGGLAYVDGDLVTTRHVWSGDLWSGTEPFR